MNDIKRTSAFPANTILTGHAFIEQAPAMLDERGKAMFGAWARGEEMPQGLTIIHMAPYEHEFKNFQRMAWALRLGEEAPLYEEARAFADQHGIDVARRIRATERE